MSWVSKPPGRLPPATNLIRIFDYQSWCLIGVSILSVSVALIIIIKIGQMYGVEIPLDYFLIFLFPLGTLTAEDMSRGFRKNKMKMKRNVQHLFFSPGFTTNGLLLLWTVMASFISMAFLSNIRAMLLKPVYESPIDSTEDMIVQGKIPIIGTQGSSSIWPKYFSESNNIWERKAGELSVICI